MSHTHIQRQGPSILKIKTCSVQNQKRTHYFLKITFRNHRALLSQTHQRDGQSELLKCLQYLEFILFGYILLFTKETEPQNNKDEDYADSELTDDDVEVEYESESNDDIDIL